MIESKIHKYILFLLLALYILYFAQGSFYEVGTIVSQAALLIIYSISAVYMLKTFSQRSKKTLFYKVWTLFLISNTIWYVFAPVEGYAFGMYKGVLLTFISFYPFYYFSAKDILKEKYFIYLFFLLLPINILQFYINAGISFSERSSYNETFTNNIAYSFAIIIPFVFLFKEKRLISFLSLFVLMFFIVQGAKRGAVLVGATGFVLFTWYQFTLIAQKGKWSNYLIIFLGVFVITYFARDYYLQQEYLANRMAAMIEGDSSGRDRILSTIWERWYHSDSLKHYLFGFGFGGAKVLTGRQEAHNDWFELLSNMGLFGVIIYLLLFYASFKLLLSPAFKKDEKVLLIAIMSMWFLTSLFSMGYMEAQGYLRSILLGFLVGEFDKTKLTLTR